MYPSSVKSHAENVAASKLWWPEVKIWVYWPASSENSQLQPLCKKISAHQHVSVGRMYEVGVQIPLLTS